MKRSLKILLLLPILILYIRCGDGQKKKENNVINKKYITAKDILGNQNYLAISYGGYRTKSRKDQPTITHLKEDMKILSAMGIKILRTYNVHLNQASNLLKAIKELRQENANFEMYVMLGAWIDCKDAFNWENGEPNHNEENERNSKEIETAIALANAYPDIVKIIAVGNEAMVKWATSYYVKPSIILKWVNYLQNLKKIGKISKDLWITSSDNFASWGGGSKEYHTDDLNKLIKAVDYISMHTYPMHDTHYNPVFWGVLESEKELSKIKKIEQAMLRAKAYAVSQYDSVFNYMKSLGVTKPIHIGETGWASFSNGQYGNNEAKATDEYKAALFYKYMRNWTNKMSMSCFYFEAFDEQWKDPKNPLGSENHFGLFKLNGEAKYVIWDLVDKGVFNGLTRNNKPITKTYNGDKEALLNDVLLPNMYKNK